MSIGPADLQHLDPEHRRLLVDDHALSGDIVDRLEFASGSRGLLIPWSDGGQAVLIGRLDEVHRAPGGPKYLWPQGTTTFLGHHVAVRDPDGDDPGTPTVLLVEGTLQSYAAASWAPSDVAVIGMQGADGVHRRTDVSWAGGRTVVVVLDADVATNTRVTGALRRVTSILLGAGAVEVRLGDLGTTATATSGLDDVLAGTAPGDRADRLRSLIDSAAVQRTVDGAGETMTDAGVSASLVADRLLGRYRWSAGLGWSSWDGRRWDHTDAVEVEEVARVYALEQWRQATRRQAELLSSASTARTDAERDALSDRAAALSPMIKAWSSYQAAGKVVAIVKMARGIPGVIARDDEWDAHPDLLNTPSGVVDLRTGVVAAHDPRLMLTKITSAPYVPGARHPDWDAAVQALPEDVREWMQLRLGQGVTGYTPGDDAMLVMDGDGRNGKTTFCEAVQYALGRDESYAVLVSHRAIIGDPSQHPTELMAFRGARLAFLEETPEEHRLNVTRLKTLLGVSTMRARRMRQDEVSWRTSHSLVLNTNYLPSVVETDHGTWRRLARVRWPYTFVAQEEAGRRALTDRERVGADGIRERLREGADGRGAAVLAWLVAGAMRWYAGDRVMPQHPRRVLDDTAEWRGLTDDLATYAGERLAFDLRARMPQVDLTRDFGTWMAERGQREWGAKLLAARVRSHSLFIENKIESGQAKVASRSTSVWLGMRLRRMEDGVQGDDLGDGPDDHGGPIPDVPLTSPVGSVGSRSDPPIENSRVEGTEREPTEPTRFTGLTISAEAPPDDVLTPAPEAVTVSSRTSGYSAPDGHLVFDLETDGLEIWGERGPGDSPFVRLVGSQTASTTVVEADTARVLAAASDPSGPALAGHNILGFDLPALARHHVLDVLELARQDRVVDTMLTWALSNPPPGGTPVGAVIGAYGLDAVARRVLLDADGLEAGKTGSFADLARRHGGPGAIPVDDPEFVEYCRRDVELTTRLLRIVVDQGWLTPYVRREHRVMACAAQIRANGFGVDLPLVESRIRGGEERKTEILTRLSAEYGLPSTGAAPQRTNAGRAAVDAAFASLGVRLPRTASGHPSSAKDVMLRLSEHPDAAVADLAGAILALNGVRTIYGTVRDHVVPGTGGWRVHPNITAYQASGRWSTTDPGLTVMGKRGGRHVEREVMIPDPGHVIIAADLSQVDARAVAAHCGDPAYAALFAPGRDMHAEIAYQVWGERTKTARDRAKVIGHGWNYGMGLRRLGETVGGPDGEAVAAQYDAAMRERYPDLVRWKSDVADEGASGRLLTNAYGRLLRVDRERAWTQSPALIGQSTARDVMMEWLMAIMDVPGLAGAVRAVVHDEVVLSVPEQDAQEVSRVLLEVLPPVLQVGDGPQVPITAEVGPVGRTWGAVYA